MTIKAVFFDLDDTLSHTSASRAERAMICARILAEADASLVAETLVQSILAPVSESNWPRGITPVLREMGIEETAHGKRASGTWFFEGCEHLICTYDGCMDLLDTLKDTYTLGIITNGPIDIQRRKYDALGLSRHVTEELFLASELIGFHKPDRRIYEHAMKLAGAAPEESVMVGDWLKVDVIGAQEAGMRGVWFNPDGLEPEDGLVPDATIQSHAELIELLLSWSKGEQ